jgi:hypothetical protein
MGLTLQACQSVVQRQNFERPDPGILPRVIRDKRCHETRLQGHFAARETLVMAPLEPCIGIVALAGPSATESVFQQLGTDA